MHQLTLVNGAPRATDSEIEVDPVLEQELSSNGFRSTRRTKLVVTIGPACESKEMLDMLASNGMNVARLNMSHGSHDWHRTIIDRIRSLNAEKGYSVAIMMDTQGSEVHINELAAPFKAEAGQEMVLTVRGDAARSGPGNVFSVSYDAFAEDVQIGDEVVIDGGMVSLEVVSKAGPDVTCRVVDPGLLLSRANLTFRRNGLPVRGKNAMLPVVSAKDWVDIDFALTQDVDFIAVSFVKSADVIKNLRSYVAARSGREIGIVAKIESYDCIPNLAEIVEASDGVMVARGDLGAQISLEDVPTVQKEVVLLCRRAGKPVIVASHLLQSMHELPTPTRAEVSDIADVVRQRADALMLSGESAAGLYPQKSLEVLRVVAARIEGWTRDEAHRSQVAAPALPRVGATFDARIGEEVCASAVSVANNLNAAAIFVFTRKGVNASWLSRFRPDCPIFAFTDSQEVRQKLNLRWGVIPFLVRFEDDPETNVTRTFELLKRRSLIAQGDLVVLVSDIQRSGEQHRSVQVRHVQ
ncbi:hypothetical protein QBZ16_002752 [Prototheca wickerhamii]|uniref:Pyruvate kinase n=1 Tax=Prototheca wickerhamii TaxID=3111 RepID=A0AAD9IN72_PROWI|nr:hypothetical protein QBZ16_002752 [Prototheca wickerhamii]